MNLTHRNLSRFLSILFALAATIPAVPALAAEGEAGARPRIISLYAAHTEVLLRLGAKDNIIGVSRQETYAGPETDGWQPEVFSFRDDVEKYLVAKPDIVLVRPQHIAGGSHQKAALERVGIQVIAIQVTKVVDLYPYWRRLAALAGREREAEAMIRVFETEVERYGKAAAARTDKPGVFLEAIHREIKTFTPDSIPAWLVELAGGRNIASDATAASPGVIIANYGPERLLSRAGEVDIFISQQGAMNRVTMDALRTREVYQPLKAFREGRVYSIPEGILARPTPSLLEGLRMLAGWTGLVVEADAREK